MHATETGQGSLEQQLFSRSGITDNKTSAKARRYERRRVVEDYTFEFSMSAIGT